MRDISNLPVALQAIIRKQLEELNNRVVTSGNKIKNEGPLFVTPDGDRSETLDVVILDSMRFNAYYDSAYKEGSFQPPACFAINKNEQFLAPVAESPKIQSETCALCPLNEFVDNTRICKNQEMVAMLPVSAIEARDDEAQIWIAMLSPTKLQAFKALITSLLTVGAMPYMAVVTISLIPKGTYFKYAYKVARYLDDEEIAYAATRLEAASKAVLYAPDFTKYKEPPPARNGARR